MVGPMRRLWMGIATRLGIRRNGLLKLQHEVHTCGYKDVQVMWEMLQKTTMDNQPPKQRQRRPLWGLFGWARRAACPCHQF
ncbi:hypothetical protein AMTR_s00144p00033840 [Amborella trichopoda]|uniref:Uncharacterized protein n=1 Tax=Amborella trichopoda TaxID=13333 RepID=W1P7I9_AMBTC|nr:hypothetical protein AMTR_s00144p00033840 [Amborella trichopoda]